MQMTYYGLFRGPILADGRMLARIPHELAQVDVPKVGGLVIFGAVMKGTNMRYYGAWLEEGEIFIGWMGTKPNIAGGEQDSSHAIGEVLGRSVFDANDGDCRNAQDAIDSFRRALQEAADDMGVG